MGHTLGIKVERGKNTRAKRAEKSLETNEMVKTQDRLCKLNAKKGTRVNQTKHVEYILNVVGLLLKNKRKLKHSTDALYAGKRKMCRKTWNRIDPEVDRTRTVYENQSHSSTSSYRLRFRC